MHSSRCSAAKAPEVGRFLPTPDPYCAYEGSPPRPLDRARRSPTDRRPGHPKRLRSERGLARPCYSVAHAISSSRVCPDRAMGDLVFAKRQFAIYQRVGSLLEMGLLARHDGEESSAGLSSTRIFCWPPLRGEGSRTISRQSGVGRKCRTGVSYT
jgi:hypothetical protein